MAMRGRGRGNPSRPRLITNRVYDKFKPMSEWRQEDDYDTLLLYLPGFQKEYIKVTTEDSNIVRVRGERLVSENKWSRFQEDYRVPENCEMRGIRAKLDGGILTITMPRKTTNVPPPLLPPPPTTTTTRAAPKPEEQPVKKTKQEEPKEKKPAKPQTTRLEEKPLPPLPPPPTTTTTRVADKTEEQPVRRTKREEPNEKKPDKPQTTRFEDTTLPLPPPQPRSSSPPTKQQPSKPAPPTKEVVEFTTRTSPRGGIEHDAEKPGVGEKTNLDKGKAIETTLEEETKRDFEGKQESSGVSGGFQADLKKVLASRGIVNEDRKLLVNVGVGVLIIAALGVHVSYTMGLIGKEK
ncbi:hypothetical protein SSX86_025351 [Deinandra increscens subsp. villosa]|uniref:SHSP domain-containing protein n=1 Tax=Deinandra increscens subsp. villosa TaxID=3103831 RepID=A0AAP0CG23_9ASTR